MICGARKPTGSARAPFFDEALRSWAAEDIYPRLAADLSGSAEDMLDDATSGIFTDREEFCRRTLLQGLNYRPGVEAQ